MFIPIEVVVMGSMALFMAGGYIADEIKSKKKAASAEDTDDQR